ncbi:lytic transglycosylase domain-containing protein [Glycomyces sp. TRM65418]|uniref:lytic transglycosylase domain-containing protein n=1 Tax=Glycomyces sp. TRM65418 TaxID=2867006 RepID=UPI001D1675A4|nr:lytic transglycosylase domain-containing protein [Glycomyces sp. TRM65418]MCC3763815.1 lytic transglycosylase domain-containing protein [Glycomyces sp. TRM65418]
MVPAIGAVTAVAAITGDPAGLDAQHPGRAAAEQQAEAAIEEFRHRHVDYLPETADVTVKAEAPADSPIEQATGLNEAESAARQAAEAAEAAADRPTSVDVPSRCGEHSGNRTTRCALMLAAGFGPDQFACLDLLWDEESGWNALAENSIGAYGIPQACPGNQMSGVGDDWRTNPVTPITWGLGYIEDRYDTPCDAWAHSEAEGFS